MNCSCLKGPKIFRCYQEYTYNLQQQLGEFFNKSYTHTHTCNIYIYKYTFELDILDNVLRFNVIFLHITTKMGNTKLMSICSQ